MYLATTRGESERTLNTREVRSGVYLIIYLYVMLHSNRPMRMLKHKHVDRKDRQDARTCKVLLDGSLD